MMERQKLMRMTERSERMYLRIKKNGDEFRSYSRKKRSNPLMLEGDAAGLCS